MFKQLKKTTNNHKRN